MVGHCPVRGKDRSLLTTGTTPNNPPLTSPTPYLTPPLPTISLTHRLPAVDSTSLPILPAHPHLNPMGFHQCSITIYNIHQYSVIQHYMDASNVILSINHVLSPINCFIQICVYVIIFIILISWLPLLHTTTKVYYSNK